VADQPTLPTRLETLQNLRTANLDAAFATAFATLVTGAFLVGFVKYLGGSDLWIGVITAVPTALGVLQIPGAIIARRYRSYKNFVLPGGLIWRAMYIPVALLPLLALNNELRLFVLVACVSIAAFTISVVNSTYNDWLAQLVPPTSRGWYFSRRNAIGAGVGAAVGLFGGLLLDRFTSIGNEAGGFAVVFGIGVVCAGISMAFFMRMRDSEQPVVQRQSLREGLATFVAPWRHRNFRKVLIFLAIFFVGQTFAGNFYAAFALETLHMPFFWIQACPMMQAIGTVASAGLWGFLADRYGNKPCLILAGVGIGLNPLAWIAASPSNLNFTIGMLICAHFMMGVFWCGVNLTQFNLLLATAPDEERASYIGSGLAVQGLVSGLAPLLGAELMAILRPGFGAEHAYKGVFWGVFGLRMFAMFFLGPVREEGSSQVRRTIRDLTKVTPRGVRALKSLRESGDVEKRAEAIHSVGTEGLSLASDEIVKALADPSPKVRRNAARALARLGDPRLAMPLIRHFEQHPDLVEEEMVEALGDVANPASVPILVKLLQSPRSLLRRAAARALGRIGSPAAIEPLIAAASEAGDPDLRRASVQALRILGATEAASVICDALFDPHPSVRTAAAEAVSELRLGSARSFLREALTYYEDEATSELVYALGCVGEPEDLPLLLGRAERQPSRTARLRCLLGAARLLGVERESYRLLLLDGFARDTALLDVLQPSIKTNARMKAAVNRYSAGNESDALGILEKASKIPAVSELAKYDIEDSFLLAAVLVAKHKKPA